MGSAYAEMLKSIVIIIELFSDLIYLILFHHPMVEANAKEGELACHGKRRKRKKEGKKIIIGRKERISGVKFITMLIMVESGEIS